MITGRETFHKSERLCSRKIIALLFDSGNTFYSPLFKVLWQKTVLKTTFPAQIAFSVPKKGFRGAVTRNLLKRRMKEAYRKNKHILYDYLIPEKIQIAVIVIFRGKVVTDYLTIEKTIVEMLDNLTNLIRENKKKC
ncbi:MAG: ribonuclease protein component [Bacteroidota bacterium]|nr:ribonuclease protein component [Bacteroidota bacterium]MDQ1332315.1 ribonuclease protein component [Bacteroidota bacterium]